MDLPNILYKYRPLRDCKYKKRLNKYTRSLLEKGELYFASPASLNDPPECRPRIIPSHSTERFEWFIILVDKLMPYLEDRFDISEMSFAEMGETALKVTEYLDSLLDKDGSLADHRIDKISNHFGIYSLSSDPLNTLLWAHYGDSHKGICIGFDTAFKPFKHARAVQYYDEVPTLTLKEVPLNDIVSLFKSVDWKYEKEWRVVKKGKGKVKIEANAIREVLLGCYCSDEDIEAVVTLIKSANLQCKVGKVIHKKGTFKLSAVEI